MTKDEFGIEIDPEVEKALSDPKSGTLMKVLDYREQRLAAAKAKADKEKKVEDKPWYDFS